MFPLSLFPCPASTSPPEHVCATLPSCVCVASSAAVIKNVHFASAAGALKSLAATKWKQSIITVQGRRQRGGRLSAAQRLQLRGVAEQKRRKQQKACTVWQAGKAVKLSGNRRLWLSNPFSFFHNLCNAHAAYPKKSCKPAKRNWLIEKAVGERGVPGGERGVYARAKCHSSRNSLETDPHISPPPPLPLLDMIYVTNTRQQKIENIYLIFTFVSHI